MIIYIYIYDLVDIRLRECTLCFEKNVGKGEILKYYQNLPCGEIQRNLWFCAVLVTWTRSRYVRTYANVGVVSHEHFVCHWRIHG